MINYNKLLELRLHMASIGSIPTYGLPKKEPQMESFLPIKPTKKKAKKTKIEIEDVSDGKL